MNSDAIVFSRIQQKITALKKKLHHPKTKRKFKEAIRRQIDNYTKEKEKYRSAWNEYLESRK